MRKILQAAKAFQDVCEAEGWPFCFIGGLAVQRWGEMRLTKDADATIFTGPGGEKPVIDRLLEVFAPRRPDAAAFAVRSRVLLLQDQHEGIGIDVSTGWMPFEQRVVERSTKFAYLPGLELRTCSAEDLIIHKAFATRVQDWRDIEGILIRQQDGLDLSIVEDELPLLVELKEEPEILERWHAMRDRYR